MPSTSYEEDRSGVLVLPPSTRQNLPEPLQAGGHDRTGTWIAGWLLGFGSPRTRRAYATYALAAYLADGER